MAIKRSRKLQVRMTFAEAAMVRRWARNGGTTVSELMRQLVTAEASRRECDVGEPAGVNAATDVDAHEVAA